MNALCQKWQRAFLMPLSGNKNFRAFPLWAVKGDANGAYPPSMAKLRLSGTSCSGIAGR